MVEQIKRLTLHRTIWCYENNQCTAFLRAKVHNGYGKAIEVDLQRVSKRNKKTNK